MNKTRTWTVWIVTIGLMFLFFGVGFLSGRNDTNNTIDNAQATSASLQNTLGEVWELLDRVSDGADDALAIVATLQSENETLVAQIAETELPEPTNTPTPLITLPPIITLSPPTITPTPDLYCYSWSTIEVVAVRTGVTNLWYIQNDNNDSWIMDIYQDDDGNRIQYPIGATFFVLEDEIETQNGTFFEVVGPLGAGLYVKESHIRLFDSNPDVDYCN